MPVAVETYNQVKAFMEKPGRDSLNTLSNFIQKRNNDFKSIIPTLTLTLDIAMKIYIDVKQASEVTASDNLLGYDDEDRALFIYYCNDIWHDNKPIRPKTTQSLNEHIDDLQLSVPFAVLFDGKPEVNDFGFYMLQKGKNKTSEWDEICSILAADFETITTYCEPIADSNGTIFECPVERFKIKSPTHKNDYYNQDFMSSAINAIKSSLLCCEKQEVLIPHKLILQTTGSNNYKPQLDRDMSISRAFLPLCPIPELFLRGSRAFFTWPFRFFPSKIINCSQQYVAPNHR